MNAYHKFKDYTNSHNLFYDTCCTYGEQGYYDPDECIIFSDWNDVPEELIQELEDAGFALEWDDEWYIDHDHNKAWRTQPNSYGWMSALVYTDSDVLTPDDDVEDVIEELQTTDQAQIPKCTPFWITHKDLEQAGFELSQKFKHGLSYGFSDPEKMQELAFKNGAQAVIFRQDHNGQFDAGFEMWIKN